MSLKLLSIVSLTCAALVVPRSVFAQSSPPAIVVQANNLDLNNLLLLGKQYVEEQNYDKALETYRQAADLDRDNPQIF